MSKDMKEYIWAIFNVLNKKIKQKLKTHKSTQNIKSFEFGIDCYFGSGDSYKLFIISKEQTKILNFLI